MKDHALAKKQDSNSATVETLKPLILIHPRAPVTDKQLFSDVLLETSSGERKRRTLATIVTLFVQCVCTGVLLLLPLMYIEALPGRELMISLLAPPPPPPPPPPAAPAVHAKAAMESNIINGQLLAPSKIPKTIAMIKENQSPSFSTGVVGGVVGGVPGGQMNGVLGGIVSNTKPPELPAHVVPTVIRVSQGVSEGMLIKKVVPEYPAVAKIAHIQGEVQLKAVISADGTIRELQLVDGSPLLAKAAMDAVAQWQYKPYLLNGVPVSVETTVLVKFILTK